MKIFTKIVLLVFVITFYAFGQNVLFNGPFDGSVASGVLVNTNTFPKIPSVSEPNSFLVHNKYQTFEPQISNYESNVRGLIDIDKNSKNLQKPNDVNSGILTKTFDGPKLINSIPPDPYIAVGPSHVIGVVNSLFNIYDKSGNLIKSIDAKTWYNTALPSNSPFDPKISYDHFADRWVMVWLNSDDAKTEAHFLISISDDSDPLGSWYNYVFRSDYEGNTEVANWSDYQGVGFDEQAVYLTGNQFGWDGYYDYNKIRIINKADLYANNGGLVKYKDLVNIRSNMASSYFTLRPTIPYTSSTNYYFVQVHNSSNMNYVTYFTLTNPLTAPTLTGKAVPVGMFKSPPRAGQLNADTTSLQLETGGSALKNEPTVIDNLIYMTYTVANSNNNDYSSIKYVCVDVNSSSAVEDVEFGAEGYWYSYPALAVDRSDNVAITFSRSGEDEYVGAFYTSRYSGDPTGLNDSKVLQAGKAYYQVDYNSGRNRWGDYNGIWTDPVDRSSFWMLTEYTSSNNIWGTYGGNLRLIPFDENNYLASSKVDFGNTEINKTSAVKEIFVVNTGTNNLNINSFSSISGLFSLVSSSHTLPISLQSFDTLKLLVTFNPIEPRIYDTTINIPTQEGLQLELPVKAKAFVINKVVPERIYASTGFNNGGQIFSIDKITGNSTVIGASLFNDVKSLTIHNGELVGLVTTLTGSGKIVRINAAGGDAYETLNIGIKDICSISFDTTGTLYAATKQGKFYKIDMLNGDTTFISNIGIPISNFTFDPLTNELYASNLLVVGERDRIYKIDVIAGSAILLGRTGLGSLVGALTFDNNGNLFGATGSTGALNDFISIDKTTGKGTKIGSTNIKHVTGLAILHEDLTSVKNNLLEVPSNFSLAQNYPNPFNPSTLIEYSLPVEARVVLNVYNLLGENVATLVNQVEKAGIHRVQFDARNLSSGIYFYEINAEAFNNSFSEMRKMILVK